MRRSFPTGPRRNAAPAVQRVKSSASAPTPYFLQLAFDATTEEQCMWSFRMPADYASAPVLKVHVQDGVGDRERGRDRGPAGRGQSDADAQDVDAKAFAAANTSGTSTVPGTAGHMNEISLTLTNADSVAAGDFVVVYLARDVAAAGDTATGDMEVIAVSLEFTTTCDGGGR